MRWIILSEVLSTCLCVLLVWHFGISVALFPALVLTFGLVYLSAIDIQYQILPDQMTLSLLWIGLFCNLFNTFTDVHSAVLGAIIGYLSFWIIAKTFQYLTGRVGMGHGDFKLLALFGAWLGWQALLPIVLISSLLGIVIGLILVRRNHWRTQRIPFGPYLAFSGWVVMLSDDNFLITLHPLTNLLN